MHKIFWCIAIFVMGISQAGCMEHKYKYKALNEWFKDSETAALADAACAGNTDKVDKLIQSGVSANAIGIENVTPLMWATSCSNLKGMEALLKHGADPNQQSDYENAVHIASKLDDVDPIKLLVKYGGNVNSKDYQSERPLDISLYAAIFSKNWDVYYYLLDEAKADIYYKGQDGDGLAGFAALFGQWDKVLELFERGYQPDLKTLKSLALSLEIAETNRTDPLNVFPTVKAILIERGMTFPVVPLDSDYRKHFFLDKIYETVLLKAVSPEKPSKSWLETGLLKDVASDKPSAEWLDSGLQQKFSEDSTYHENGDRRFETNNNPEESFNFSIVTGKDGNTIKKMMVILPSAHFYQKRSNSDLPSGFNKEIKFLKYIKSIDYTSLVNNPNYVDWVEVGVMVDGKVYLGSVSKLDYRMMFMYFEFK